MIRLEETVSSPLPVDLVWPRMADFANTAQWDPGVAAAQRTDAGPLREGSTFDVDVRAGTTMRMRYRVLVFDPPRRVVLEGVGTLFRAIDDIRVAPDGDGSRVTWRADLGLRGPLSVLEPLMRRSFQQVGDEAMAGLRAWLAS